MNSSAACCICSQIAGDISNDLFFKLVGDSTYIRRVPVESNNFAAIPSLGPLVEGHILLCPKLHVKSLASLPSSLDDEFTSIRDRLSRLLRNIYGLPVHLFEHGMSKSGERVLCTVDHAHLHLIPADVTVLDHLCRSGMTLQSVDRSLSRLRSEVQEAEYLYYESPDHQGFVLKPDGKEVKSQFLRKVFADTLGQSDLWNWREVPRPDVAERCFKRLAVVSLGAAEFLSASD